MNTNERNSGTDFWLRVVKVDESFRAHVDSVQKLVNFDQDVLDIAIVRLETLRQRIVSKHRPGDLDVHVLRTVMLLKNIRKNDSLRSRYETIFNQALVLLVSYFSSTMHDLFCCSVRETLIRDNESPLLKEQLRLTFRELRDANFELLDRAADLLVQTKDISFQDMQSIARAFKEYIGVILERNDLVNDLILALSCRHVIVHNGGTADRRFLRQIEMAIPRRIKPKMALGARIQFSDLEVGAVGKCMIEYVESVGIKILEHFDVDRSLWNQTSIDRSRQPLLMDK